MFRSFFISLPSAKIFPEVGSSKPKIILISVDFPHPVLPIIPIDEFFFISIFISFKTNLSVFWYL